MLKEAGTIQKKRALSLAATFLLKACKESSCCYISRLQIWEEL